MTGKHKQEMICKCIDNEEFGEHATITDEVYFSLARAIIAARLDHMSREKLVNELSALLNSFGIKFDTLTLYAYIKYMELS